VQLEPFEMPLDVKYVLFSDKLLPHETWCEIFELSNIPFPGITSKTQQTPKELAHDPLVLPLKESIHNKFSR
jgi:hypothetical protein